MRLLLTRIRHNITTTLVLHREQGWRRASMYLLRHYFCRHRILLFRGPSFAGELDPPLAPISIECYRPEEISSHMDVLQQIEKSTFGLRFAREGATVYIAFWQENPVGIGWLFPRSRILEQLRLAARMAMVGGFEVRNEYRGRNIYPAMLRRIDNDLARKGISVFAEAALENRSSQRGLQKAGYECCGELRFWVIFGLIVGARLVPAPPW